MESRGTGDVRKTALAGRRDRGILTAREVLREIADHLTEIGLARPLRIAPRNGGNRCGRLTTPNPRASHHDLLVLRSQRFAGEGKTFRRRPPWGRPNQCGPLSSRT